MSKSSLIYCIILLFSLISSSANAEQLSCSSSIDQLINVNVNYWGFDNKPHTGVLMVNKNVVQDVTQIFQTLYQAKFPIAKIQPVSVYQDDENKAMADNDTFSFSCRFMTGNSQFISKHAYGLAIDINPLINPYVRGKVILPPSGKKYLHRTSSVPGMIVNNDIVVQTFKKYGWIWGGNWKSIKDYQHFEKM